MSEAAIARLALRAPLWPDPVRTGLLLRLKTASDGVAGWLVAGCSPRRPLDAGYRAFMALVAGQTGASMADAQAHEAERRRTEALALAPPLK